MNLIDPPQTVCHSARAAPQSLIRWTSESTWSTQAHRDQVVHAVGAVILGELDPVPFDVVDPAERVSRTSS